MEHLSPFSKPKYKYYPSNPRASTKLMQVRFSHAACCKQKKLLNIIAFGPNWGKWFLTACHKQVWYHIGDFQTYVEHRHIHLKNQANMKGLLHSNTLQCLYSVSELNCLTFEPALNLKSMYSKMQSIKSIGIKTKSVMNLQKASLHLSKNTCKTPRYWLFIIHESIIRC